MAALTVGRVAVLTRPPDPPPPPDTSVACARWQDGGYPGYPPRPAAALVFFVGPVDPGPLMVDGDQWIQVGAGSPPPEPALWSDLYPGGDPTGMVHLHQSVIIDRDVTVDGLMVHHHAGTPMPVVELDPARSVLVQSSGSIAVEDGATLRMRPASPEIVHEVRFVGVDESLFVGRGGAGGAPMDHADFPDDIGLWVHGTLDLVGAERNSWTRTVGGVTAGATSITVEDASGWRAGDEIAISPTGDPSLDSEHHTRYDERTITAITPGAGTQATLTLSSAVTYDHPAAVFDGYRDGQVVEFNYPPEVLNLTRNVVVGGTPTGRSHMMVHASSTVTPLRVENVKLSWMGPQVFTSPTQQDEHLGRYPFHFHFADGTRAGSVLRNIVVVDSGLRAFVAHATHDITWDRCVTHRSFHAPFWWDMKLDGGHDAPLGPQSDRVAYLGCVASQIHPFPSYRGFGGQTGFALAHGAGTRCVGCVAVAVYGAQTSSGYNWPEPVNGADDNVWEFHDNIAHNNRVNGTYAWQNDFGHPHLIENCQFYRNNVGFLHGAYGNTYTYRDVTCWQNAEAGVELHAQSDPSQAIVMDRLWLDGGGTGNYALGLSTHRALPAVEFVDCRFAGWAQHGVLVAWGSEVIDPDNLHLLDPVFDGAEADWFWFNDHAHPDARIEVEFTGGDHYELHRHDWPAGSYVADWNAKRVDL